MNRSEIAQHLTNCQECFDELLNIGVNSRKLRKIVREHIESHEKIENEDDD